MSRITGVRNRLHDDDGLPGLLDTAYAAFELLLSAIEGHEDPATGMFAQFVFAATQAANGRDAILSAPSLPGRPLRPAPTSGTSWHSARSCARSSPGPQLRRQAPATASPAGTPPDAPPRFTGSLPGPTRDRQGYLRRLPPAGSS
jgi:hypothetical protein